MRSLFGASGNISFEVTERTHNVSRSSPTSGLSCMIPALDCAEAKAPNNQYRAT